MKKLNFRLAAAVAALSSVPAARAETSNEAPHSGGHDHIEEVHVVSSPLERTLNETALPITRVDGEALRQAASNSLGETLSDNPGIRTGAFGPGVGQPVIRGQSGARVQVLSNGVAALDASAASPDHANSVEPLVAEAVEVIRGPATLLYGNGAIGGVVNVIDNRVPDEAISEPTLRVEQRYASVNDQWSGALVGETAFAGLNWHLDGSWRSADDTDVKAFRHEGETLDHIPNSSMDDQSLTLGTSYTADWGYIGLSGSRQEKDYGLPPGVHAHAGHDDEHDEHEEEVHHDEELHDEPLSEDEHSLEDDPRIRIDMVSDSWQIKGRWLANGSLIEYVDFSLVHSDYRHTELEAAHDTHEEEHIEHEDGHEEEHADEAGHEEEAEGHSTRYERKGTEARVLIRHADWNNLSGAWGLQVRDAEFAALGEEAFVPRTEIRSVALFAVETLDLGDWSLEAGLRAENQKLSPVACERETDTLSASVSALWHYRDNTSLFVSGSRSSRAPATEELYSNVDPSSCAPESDPEHWVVHAATNQIELGNPDLDRETASHWELGWRHQQEALSFEANLFYNDIDDYIYLPVSEASFEEVAVVVYDQADALFQGVEFRMQALVHDFGNSDLDLTLFADSVSAKLANGDPLPRIPSRRVGMELHWHSPDWSASIGYISNAAQNQTAPGEEATRGSGELYATVDYHWQAFGVESVVFLKGSNLHDAEIYRHESVIKEQSPAPGRNIEAGIRLAF